MEFPDAISGLDDRKSLSDGYDEIGEGNDGKFEEASLSGFQTCSKMQFLGWMTGNQSARKKYKKFKADWEAYRLVNT